MQPQDIQINQIKDNSAASVRSEKMPRFMPLVVFLVAVLFALVAALFYGMTRLLKVYFNYHLSSVYLYSFCITSVILFLASILIAVFPKPLWRLYFSRAARGYRKTARRLYRYWRSDYMYSFKRCLDEVNRHSKFPGIKTFYVKNGVLLMVLYLPTRTNIGNRKDYIETAITELKNKTGYQYIECFDSIGKTITLGISEVEPTAKNRGVFDD